MDLLCFCSVLCLLCLCASVYMCFVVTCWERADLLALVCGVFCEFVTFPLVSWVRCGTWLYRFLIFAPLLTLKNTRDNQPSVVSNVQIIMRIRAIRSAYTNAVPPMHVFAIVSYLLSKYIKIQTRKAGLTCANPEGGGGDTCIGFFSDIGPDPPGKSCKVPKPAFNVVGPLMARL